MDNNISKPEHKMEADCAIYHENALIYDLFSRAEDARGCVAEYLAEELRGKRVLDIGCGTGKYLTVIAPIAKQYIGIDCSKEQLKIAKTKAEQFSNTSLIQGYAQQTGLCQGRIDAVLSAWVLESIRNVPMQDRILAEMNRVLRNQGAIYVVENSGESEFEDIIRRTPDISTTKENQTWLLYHGFEQVKRFESYFLFDSAEQARMVFSTIWDQTIASRIKDRRINQNINIYKKVKL
jgi:ubiquinone/menaquinone biosynthesis C-methylase UbiE